MAQWVSNLTVAAQVSGKMQVRSQAQWHRSQPWLGLNPFSQKLPYATAVAIKKKKNNYLNMSSNLGVRNSGRAHLNNSSALCGNI